MIKELGCAGHFIAAIHCQWRRHTQIGDKYRISTVGDYYFDDERQSLSGLDPTYYFETMVFPTSANKADDGGEYCGCHEVLDWSGLDIMRYHTAGEAQAGHEAMIEKYRRKMAWLQEME